MTKGLIIGSPGAGKSTFARKLRDATGLPLYHLDLLWHRPDQTTYTQAEFDRALNQILKKDRWILDGNYQRTLSLRLISCDTVFLLDIPVELCLAGAQSRVGKKRGDLPWIETHFDEAFRQEILHFPQIQLPQIYKQLEHCQGQKEIFIFHTRQEADAYLAALSR